MPLLFFMSYSFQLLVCNKIMVNGYSLVATLNKISHFV